MAAIAAYTTTKVTTTIALVIPAPSIAQHANGPALRLGHEARGHKKMIRGYRGTYELSSHLSIDAPQRR